VSARQELAALRLVGQSSHAASVTAQACSGDVRVRRETAGLDDQRQRDAERGPAQRRCRFEAEGAASPGNHPGSETAPSGQTEPPTESTTALPLFMRSSTMGARRPGGRDRGVSEAIEPGGRAARFLLLVEWLTSDDAFGDLCCAQNYVAHGFWIANDIRLLAC
jgi:hypothetical protein